MRLDRPESQGKGKSLRGIFTFYFSVFVFFCQTSQFLKGSKSFTRLPGPDVLLELKKKDFISSLDKQ